MTYHNISSFRSPRTSVSDEAYSLSGHTHERASADSHQNARPKPEESTSSKNDVKETPATALRPSFYILSLAILYSMLNLSAWIIICILSYRPLTTKSYAFQGKDEDPDPSVYAVNENWYRAARVIQSIASVLTIPLTSAVCANAAVIFIQRNGAAINLTIRQLLALSDKGWTDPALYFRALRHPRSSWKRYGTWFLVLAIFLHILGGLISPLQALLLSSKTIKVPSGWSTHSAIAEIIDMQQYDYMSQLSVGIIASLAGPLIRSAYSDQYEPQIWSAAGLNCTGGAYCNIGNKLGDISSLDGPFLAQLPNGFHTGVLRQFAPRFNFSTTVTKPPLSEFPADCESNISAFYANYNHDLWGLQVCIPQKSSQGFYTTWNATRNRQDLSEELYINITVRDLQALVPGYEDISGLLKVSVNTTEGYFELPNYMNSGIPGPLQTMDPFPRCGEECEGQTPDGWYLKPREANFYNTANNFYDLLLPGPLTTLAYAMFGDWDSYMVGCDTALNDAAFSKYTYEKGIQYCSNPPLINLLRGSSYLYRKRDMASKWDTNNSNDEGTLLAWLRALWEPQNGTSTIENAFNTGLFLATQALLQACDLVGLSKAGVYSDPGVDTEIPTISLAGIIAISTLLAIYLVSLLGMATYGAHFPRWTDSLDGFAMMRIGATIADKVPLLVTYRVDEIEALDDTPGWIGDSERVDEECKSSGIARLELGSSGKLRARQRYECYPADHSAAPLEVHPVMGASAIENQSDDVSSSESTSGSVSESSLSSSLELESELPSMLLGPARPVARRLD
ncbi:hypothetical protein VTN00DRAFT_4886 [Thermoascus crustaceus]|uniref:uncharacterized protein n=1 Tax=Thermoascus crustaceus TaxID=5088 RepID=UPI003742A969